MTPANREARPPKQEQEPASDEITEVAPDVLRLQLPVDLPGLGHVNCYALVDGEGVALVDPGLPGRRSWDALVARLTAADIPLDRVHTTIVTHSHTDHFGGAIRLREATETRLVCHESFRPWWNSHELAENPDSGTLELNDDEAIDAFLKQSGDTTPWGTPTDGPPIEMVRTIIEDRAPGSIYPTVEAHLRLVDGEPIELARREWFAVHTPGHTDDHLCLYDPTNGVMLSGDHVLPTITPHVGGWDSQNDTVGLFLGSLRRMNDFADVTTVLPAHGHPFDDLVRRASAIVRHHDERLDLIRTTASELGTADVVTHMRRLFRERSWGTMAESETFAHLVHLEQLGEIARVDQPGVATFSPGPG